MNDYSDKIDIIFNNQYPYMNGGTWQIAMAQIAMAMMVLASALDDLKSELEKRDGKS